MDVNKLLKVITAQQIVLCLIARHLHSQLPQGADQLLALLDSTAAEHNEAGDPETAQIYALVAQFARKPSDVQGLADLLARLAAKPQRPQP